MLESLSDHPNVRDAEEQPPFTAVGVGDVTRAVHVTVKPEADRPTLINQD